MTRGEPDRRDLEIAVLETVLYSDLFDYPLTVVEIAHYLIGVKADAEAVAACLRAPRYLNGHLRQLDGFIVACRRESLIERRRVRRTSSARLWARARRLARWLAAMPFVRMVAVTGSLAMDNSSAHDDIDVLIVTRRGRVWTARGLAIGLFYVSRLFKDKLCPNYVVSEDALTLETRDLFTAHEFAQMVPLVGLDVYDQMCRANAWVYEYLPNACEPLRAEHEICAGPVWRALKRFGEWLLGGRLGDALETWEMRRKQRKFAPLITESSNAILDADHAKGHFEDYGVSVKRLYAERLVQLAQVRGDA